MSAFYNSQQGLAKELHWIGFEAVECDKHSSQFIVSLCLGQWLSWDQTVDGLSDAYDQLNETDFILREHFTGKISHHLIVKAGASNYHPLWHPAALASCNTSEDLRSTVAFKWYIIGPWLEMKQQFEQLSRNHMNEWLTLAVSFEYNNLNLEVVPMDKQINKVKKDVEKNDKPKAKKDIKKLLKMDKKFDAKLDKCDKMKKGSK